MTKSEHEPRLPKLAKGSRWNDDGTIVDVDGAKVWSDTVTHFKDTFTVLGIGFHKVEVECYSDDALAAIRSKGLDQLAIAAKELVRYRETSCEPLPGAVLDFIEAAKELL